MNTRTEMTFSALAERARDRYEDAVKGARRRSERAAGRITRTKKPVKTLSKLGVKLSDLSHQTASKLLKQQTKLVEAQIDAVAGRLQAAADATDLRDFFRTQIRLIPENSGRFADDAREAFRIVRGAGGEVRGLVRETVDELRGRKPVARKPAAAKASRKKVPARGRKATTTRKKTATAVRKTPAPPAGTTGNAGVAA